MLRFFRKNHVFNSLLLFPYALLLRLVALVFSESRMPGAFQGVWGDHFISVVQGGGAREILVAAVLVFFQAALLNRLSIRHNLLGEISLLPGLAYVLLTAMHPAFLGLSSALVATTTLLIALSYLFDAIKKERAEENKFMIGWWLGVSGLLYVPFLVLGFFGLAALSMLKTIKGKEVVQYVTGFATPFFLGWLIRVIQAGRPVGIDPALFNFVGLPELVSLHPGSDLVPLLLFIVLVVFSLVGYSQIVARKNIHAQKKLDTVYLYMLFCLPMVFFDRALSAGTILVLALPLSIFLAIRLRQVRLNAIAESMHFMLVILAWAAQVLAAMG